MRYILFLSISLMISNFSFGQCSESTSQSILNINNAKAKIANAGNYLYNLDTIGVAYEITANSQIRAIFNMGLWIGGLDTGGSLRIAAQTYRQNGNDFWPGPLDHTGNITATDCEKYDRFWSITALDVQSHINLLSQNGGTLSLNQISQNILEWPANGNVNSKDALGNTLIVNQEMAPYFDADANNVYNPENGDYPAFCGDKAIYWVFNDMGNVHTETNGLPIGIEVHNLAYAFSTNNYLNDVTFFSTKVVNKGNNTLTQAYISLFVDSDLGCPSDYIGCDTALNLAITYNPTSYCDSIVFGNDPPILATQILGGPVAINGNGIDDDKDGLIDEGTDSVDNNQNGLIDEPLEQERINRMSGFMYYNNDFSVTGNPETAYNYFSYMQNKWKDNSSTTYGGNGYGGLTNFPYMYIGNPSDSSGWSECTMRNPAADRRYLQNIGPFNLTPGEINYFDFAIIWDQPIGGFTCGDDYNTTISVVASYVEAYFNQMNCWNNSSSTVGLNQIEYSDGVNIYPNPVNEIFTIEFETFAKVKQITIIGIDGKQFIEPYNINNKTISISSYKLNSGIYFIHITTAKGAYTKRFVKL